MTLTRQQAHMLSEALTQYLENANDPEERSDREADNIALACQMLDDIDSLIAE